MADSDPPGRPAEPVSAMNEQRNLPVPVTRMTEADTEGFFSRLAPAPLRRQHPPPPPHIPAAPEAARPRQPRAPPAQRPTLPNTPPPRRRPTPDPTLPP